MTDDTQISLIKGACIGGCIGVTILTAFISSLATFLITYHLPVTKNTAHISSTAQENKINKVVPRMQHELPMKPKHMKRTHS